MRNIRIVGNSANAASLVLTDADTGVKVDDFELMLVALAPSGWVTIARVLDPSLQRDPVTGRLKKHDEARSRRRRRWVLRRSDLTVREVIDGHPEWEPGDAIYFDREAAEWDAEQLSRERALNRV